LRKIVQKFQALIGASNFFKIGRCQAADFDGLASRPMYEGHEDISVVYRGPRASVEVIEEFLIGFAKRKFTERCMNEQEGGGPLGEDKQHIVYVVRRPDSDEGQLFAMLSGMQDPEDLE